MAQVTKGSFTASKDSGGYNEKVQIQVPQNTTNSRKTETFVVRNSDRTKQIVINCIQYAQGELITSNIQCVIQPILNSRNLNVRIYSDQGIGNVQFVFNVIGANGNISYTETIDVNTLSPQQTKEIVLQDAITENQSTTNDYDVELLFAANGMSTYQDDEYSYFISISKENE